jgi:hypothetical protein
LADLGVRTEDIRQLGAWRSQEVFFDRYFPEMGAKKTVELVNAIVHLA